MLGKGTTTFVMHQKDITMSLMTMRTTTNIGKVQKFCKKVCGE